MLGWYVFGTENFAGWKILCYIYMCIFIYYTTWNEVRLEVLKPYTSAWDAHIGGLQGKRRESALRQLFLPHVLWNVSIFCRWTSGTVRFLLAPNFSNYFDLLRTFSSARRPLWRCGYLQEATWCQLQLLPVPSSGVATLETPWTSLKWGTLARRRWWSLRRQTIANSLVFSLSFSFLIKMNVCS